MLEEILKYIKGLDDIWIILIATVFSFLENICPPLPSDIIVIASSGLLKDSNINLIILFFLCTLFSTLGFLTVYSLGVFLEDRFIEKRKIRFIDPKLITKAHNWFLKIGYYLILINRFFPGIRSVIALFSGINRLNILKVTVLSFISSLIWNAILIYAGQILSVNWKIISEYFSNYTLIISGIVILIIIIFYFSKIRKGENEV